MTVSHQESHSHSTNSPLSPARGQEELFAAYLYASQQLVSLTAFEEKLYKALDRLGEAFAVNHIYIFEHVVQGEATGIISHRYEWVKNRDGLVVARPEWQNISHSQLGLARWEQSLRTNEIVFGTIDDFTPTEQAFLQRQNIKTIALLPVHIEGRWQGFLGIDDCETKRMWTAVEIEILKSLAGAIGAALTNVRLYHDERQTRTQAEVLHEFARIVSSSLDYRGILRQSLQHLKRILIFDAASIYLTAVAGQTGFIAVIGFDDVETTAESAVDLLTESPILRRMAQDLTPVLFGDVRQVDEWIWVEGAEQVRSFLATPLVINNKMVGALMLDSFQTDFFLPSDLKMVQTLAQHLSIAIENARLYERANQDLFQKTALLDAATAVSQSLDLPTVLNRLTEKLCQAIGATSAYVLDWHAGGHYCKVITEYYSANASSAECVSDLGHVYDAVEDFDAYYKNILALQPFTIHVSDANLNAKERRHLVTYGAKSILHIPLAVKGNMVGIVELWESRSEREFTTDEIALCTAIAHHASIAMENARLFAAERRQLHLSQTLQQIGQLLTTSLDLEEVYERVFDLLNDVIDYDSVSLQLRDGVTNKLDLIAGRGFDNIEFVRQLVQQSGVHALDKVTSPPYWAVIPNTMNDDRWLDFDSSESPTIRSWVGAALIIEDEIIGILNVDSKTPYAYDHDVGQTVAAFATQAAVAIKNARLYDEIQNRANVLEVLYQISTETAVIVDIDQLLDRIVRLVVDNFGYEAFGIALCTPDMKYLQPHPSAWGLPVPANTALIPIESSIVGRAVLTGEPQIIGDLRRESEKLDLSPDTLSELVLPIKSRDKILGIMNVESVQLNAFADQQLQFFVTLSSQVAAALERVDLYEKLRSRASALAEIVAQRTAELQAERDRTLAILESAGEGIVLIDVEARIMYANRTLVQQSGYKLSELQGESIRLLTEAKSADATLTAIAQVVTQGEYWSGEMVNQRQDGSLYDVAVTITPLYDEADVLTGYVCVQSDISRLKEVERLKSKFVANVSHELRTPLTNIKTFIALLDKGRPDKRERYMQVLHNEIDRLSRLIQDLLDLSRLEAETMPPQRNSNDLKKIIQQYYEVFAAKAENRHLNFKMILPETLPPTSVKHEHLGQLLTNLLGNAFAYTPQGGDVIISAGQDEGDQRPLLWVRVTDTGAGISTNDLPHLFDRFYRGQAALQYNSPGTGLGLPICREIVMRYGGTLEVDSTEGVGSTFTAWLPIAEDDDTR